MFLKKLFIFCVILIQYTKISLGANYIYDGLPAAVGQFPYQALIRGRRVPYCGGAIINKEYILTVQNCMDDKPDYMKVVIGTNNFTSGGAILHVQALIRHPKIYNKYVDLGMLKVHYDIVIPNVKSVVFREKSVTEDMYPLLNLYSNDTVMTGW